MCKGNRVPRTFNLIVVRGLTDSSGGKAGDVWHVTKDDGGYHGLNTRTGVVYQMFVEHLRAREYFEFLEVS